MEYSIIGIVAIIVNIIINRDVYGFGKNRPDTDVMKAYRIFNYAILTYHVTDVLWGFFDAAGTQIPLYIDTIIYYLAMYMAVMFWARYVVKYLDDHGAFSKILLIAGNVLLAVEVIALVLNHFNHFFFWVDEAGDYHAYTFRYVALVIQIVMLLAASCYAFARQKSAEEHVLKGRYRTIGAFGITMVVAIGIQFFFPLLPFYSIGYLIGTCLIHSCIIEDENEELRKKADEANEAKTSFLFNLSHDIRTPMNAILGFTDIGLRHIDSRTAVEESLEKIKTSGGHLLSLINDILEMSHIESGNLSTMGSRLTYVRQSPASKI